MDKKKRFRNGVRIREESRKTEPKLSILETAKLVVFYPKRFFPDIKRFTGIRHPTVFMIVFFLVLTIILTYKYLGSLNNIMTETANSLKPLFDMLGVQFLMPRVVFEFDILTYVIAYGFFVMFFFSMTFLRYYITHLFVRAFGGNYGYYQTHKSMAYTLTPQYITEPVFLAALIMFAMPEKSWLLWSGIAVLLLIGIAFAVYQIYLRITGLARLQEIAIWQSFLIIYVVGEVAFFLLVFVIFLILTPFIIWALLSFGQINFL
jgi:hypothetical protein